MSMWTSRARNAIRLALTGTVSALILIGGSGGLSVTSPARAATDPVIAIASDVQIHANLDTSWARKTSDLALSMAPDQAWLAGDEAEDATAAEYATYSEHWGRLGTKLAVVPGNHEVKNGWTMPAYTAYFGALGNPLPRVRNVGAWRVYFLDSNRSFAIGSASYEFVKADLAAHANQPIAAVWHHPLWSNLLDPWASSDPTRQPMWDLLYAAHADLIINGHSHSYQRWAQLAPNGNPDNNGIREFIVATGGDGLMAFAPPDSRVQYEQNKSRGVMRLVLHPTSYEWQFVSTTGEVLDSGSTATHNGRVADPSPPTAPTGLTATSVNSNQVALGWTASSDNVGVNGYRVDRDGVALATVTTTSFTDTTVAPSTNYSYRVTALDAAGNTSPASDPLVIRTPAPPAATIAFHGSADFSGNVNSAPIAIPSAAKAGDELMLFATVNVATTSVTVPAGWTPLANFVTGSARTMVWSRLAITGDSGRTISLGFGTYTKTIVQLVAYGGVTTANALGAVATKAETSTTISHTTPSVPVSGTGQWLVSYWADKSSTTTAWTPPAASAVRTQAVGSGSGRISALVTDSGAPVPTGTAGGLTAFTNAGSLASTVSILIR